MTRRRYVMMNSPVCSLSGLSAIRTPSETRRLNIIRHHSATLQVIFPQCSCSSLYVSRSRARRVGTRFPVSVWLWRGWSPEQRMAFRSPLLWHRAQRFFTLAGQVSGLHLVTCKSRMCHCIRLESLLRFLPQCSEVAWMCSAYNLSST